ncbi:MAG: hypothetical protein M5U19_15655 [Microthrixaceae bacterium]|nr:hypothetical protein [Microthrixaceae bacterium]
MRVGGVLGLDELTRRTGSERSRVDQALVELERTSMVRRNSGALSGWSLTGAGRARGESLLAEELDSLGVRSGVLALYGVFGVVNAELLVICTAWQVRAGVDPPELNDHADACYDAGVLDRLSGLHHRASAMLSELEDLLPRFCRLPAPVGHGVGSGRPRGGGLGHQADDRLVPHGVVRTPRGSPGHAWQAAQRRSRLLRATARRI